MTPTKQWWIKLAEHAVVIFVFNAVLAAVVFFNQAQGDVNWSLLAVSVVAQAVLAVLDAGKTYLAAHGQPALAAVAGQAETGVTAVAKPAPLPAPVQQAATTINQVLASDVPAMDTLPFLQAVQPQNGQ